MAGKPRGLVSFEKGGCSYTHGKLGSSDGIWRLTQDLNDKEGLARGGGARLMAKESVFYSPHGLGFLTHLSFST